VDLKKTLNHFIFVLQEFRGSVSQKPSSMGTGNKLDPSRFQIGDIYDTSVCPLCRVMRRELRKRGIPKLKVLYSLEEPIKPKASPEPPGEGKRQVPGSISFVPSCAGLLIAGEVIRDLIQKPELK